MKHAVLSVSICRENCNPIQKPKSTRDYPCMIILIQIDTGFAVSSHMEKKKVPPQIFWTFGPVQFSGVILNVFYVFSEKFLQAKTL